MNDAEYFAAPGVSNSAIGVFLKSPRLYKILCVDRSLKTESTDAQDFGTAFHLRLLQPDGFYRLYIKAPQVAVNTTKWKQFVEANPDKIPLKENTYEKVEQMVAAINNHPVAGALILPCEKELPVFWSDEVTGLGCKAKLDAFNAKEGYIIDVKTTSDVFPRSFSESIGRYGYYRQAAYYSWGATNALKKKFNKFYFVAIAKEPPYMVRVYSLAERDLVAGLSEARQALVEIKKCEMTKDWGYQDDKIEEISRPSWCVSNDIIEKELT